MDGAAILLQSDTSPSGSAATAGSLGESLAAAELALGEGPGHQVMLQRTPVFADQLITGPSEAWPMFALEATQLEIEAVFAFPLHLGSIAVGALVVCRRRPGKLTAPELIELSTLASLATSALLLMQSGLVEGELFDLLEAGNPSQLRIHQATGMVAEQLSVPMSDALAVMRGHALTRGIPLVQVAEEVISRKIRMDA